MRTHPLDDRNDYEVLVTALDKERIHAEEEGLGGIVEACDRLLGLFHGGVSFYRAQTDTAHFSFEAYGATCQHACDTLLAGWQRHCQVVPGADPTLVGPDDIDVLEVQLGGAWRDSTQLLAPRPRQEPA